MENEGDIPIWGWQTPLRYLGKNYANKERIQDFFDDYDIREYGGLLGWNVQYNVSPLK